MTRISPLNRVCCVNALLYCIPVCMNPRSFRLIRAYDAQSIYEAHDSINAHRFTAFIWHLELSRFTIKHECLTFWVDRRESHPNLQVHSLAS